MLYGATGGTLANTTLGSYDFHCTQGSCRSCVRDNSQRGYLFDGNNGKVKARTLPMCAVAFLSSSASLLLGVPDKGVHGLFCICQS